MRKKLIFDDNDKYAKEFIKLFVNIIKVTKSSIFIEGSKTALIDEAKNFNCGVHSSVGKWRPQRDLNPRCRRERPVS